ncbi:MAG: mannitol dehydrogenase family protein [Cryobacterium sp.]|nr:mannitol dehydrogenase family protein [Cryobacterium sp.]
MPATGLALDRREFARLAQESRPTAPVRIVHLGLGAFHRAHQAWYTDLATDATQWGIAAFTGRSPELAQTLEAQDGLYTLLERADHRDTARVVQSIVEVRDGAEMNRFLELLADPNVAIVTLTVTEAGYRLTPDLAPDLEDELLSADVVLLRSLMAAADSDPKPPTAPSTPLGRLLLGLDARRRRDSGAIAIVPCDNIPANGRVVGEAVLALADLVCSETGDWIRRNVSFVSTSVDRITPRTTPEDSSLAAELTGWSDLAPVVTEPFSDWVLAGDFPAGRPRWESAGARFVDDVGPFERRKLWLLNGAHSLLAYVGMRRGHQTVAEAIGDPVCRSLVEALWTEASRHLAHGLEIDAYRASLLERFGNSRIEHRLDQIGVDAVLKLRARIVDVAIGELATGRTGEASARVIAAWISLLRAGSRLRDSAASAIDSVLAAGWTADTPRSLVGLIDHDLAWNSDFISIIETVLAEEETP